jgi:hypothetical protein
MIAQAGSGWLSLADRREICPTSGFVKPRKTKGICQDLQTGCPHSGAERSSVRERKNSPTTLSTRTRAHRFGLVDREVSCGH